VSDRPWIHRPEPAEYGEYFGRYISQVPDGDIVETLAREGARAVEIYGGLTHEQSSASYGEGKWSVRQVVAHVSDAERVFTYRALRFARADATPLPGFDQEAWEPYTYAAERSWSDVVDEFRAVRAASVHLFRSFPAAAWNRQGIASEVVVSVRAFAWITAGHDLHHRRILRERYGIAD
jgi:hypothetical protein